MVDAGVGEGDADEEEEKRLAVLQHKQPLEMYAFLLGWLVGVMEKVGNGKGGGEDVVPTGRGKVSFSRLYGGTRLDQR